MCLIDPVRPPRSLSPGQGSRHEIIPGGRAMVNRDFEVLDGNPNLLE
jgi:hypothetical protein